MTAGSSVADRLSMRDDADASGLLLEDLEDLSEVTVLAVGGIRASVLELQAVLHDPLVCRFQGGDELLRADDEDDVGGAPYVGGELAAGGRGDDQRSVASDCVDAAEGVVRLAGYRLHLGQLRFEVELRHPVACRVVRSASLIAFVMPASSSVTEVLVITEAPSGM
jgi:hypothetical protein